MKVCRFTSPTYWVAIAFFCSQICSRLDFFDYLCMNENRKSNMLYSSIPQSQGNLRPYQLQAKDRILHAWDDYDSVMLQMPTGTGKTYLFTSLIRDILDYYKAQHQELHVLMVAHRMELLDQISASLTKYGIPHGFIQGSREQHLWQRIQVGSIMSLISSRNEQNIRRLDFDYIIVDEAHHSLADSYKRLFELFPHAKKLGVTATPWRLNHETFTSLYQKLITTPQISWFISHGVLADFDYVSIKPDSKLQRMILNTEVSQTGDYVNMELDNAFNTQRIRSKLLESYKKYAKGKKGIIYAINKVHAAKIAEMYKAHGFVAVAIDCDTPKEERMQLVDAFKRGDIQILVNVDIFTEGFDCPDVSFIQLARPTRSLALYLQQVGRGLRVVAHKEKTIILDNVGLYNSFGLPDVNRQWIYFFVGHEWEAIHKSPTLSGMSSTGFRSEPNLEEENEAMMIVRGGHIEAAKSKESSSKESLSTESLSTESLSKKGALLVENRKVLPIAEFMLCDYYLVRGNSEAFSVYPLLKRKGRITQGVSTKVYEYRSEGSPFILSNDTTQNINFVTSDWKAETIVMLSSSFCGVELRNALDLEYVGKRLGETLHSQISLYEMLEFLQKLYQKRNERVSKQGKA